MPCAVKTPRTRLSGLHVGAVLDVTRYKGLLGVLYLLFAAHLWEKK